MVKSKTVIPRKVEKINLKRPEMSRKDNKSNL